MSDVSEGYALEPAELDAIVGQLENARTDLAEHPDAVAVSPDAGQSSDEVARAFGILAAALGALSEGIGGIAGNLADNVATYRATEGAVAGAFDVPGLTP